LLAYFIIFDKQNITASVIIALVANILTGPISYKIFWVSNFFNKLKEKEAEIENLVDEEWNKVNAR
jgi:hypothetical protein